MDGQARVSVILELRNKLKTGLAQAKQSLNSTVSDMKGKLNELKTSHIESFKAMGNEIPGFSRVMQLATNPYVLLAAAVVGLGVAFAKASEMAQAFDERMAHANVTLQMSKPELKKAKNEVLNLAANSSVKDAATAAPDALNIFASANLDDDKVKNYQLSLAAIQPTLEAAKWGFADVATVARAAALSMNASGIKDATQVYDVLAATLNKGNAEFSTIAQYLPKLIAQAKTAGISFQETAGAYAFMTQKFTGEKSATMLENIVKNLQDADKVHAFKKLGVEVYDSHGKMKALVDIAGQLNKAVGGLSPELRNVALGSLNLDIEAQTGFSAMMQNVDGLKDSIDATVNSAGQAKLALENAKTPMDGWRNIANQIDVAWIRIGETINENIVAPLGAMVNDALNPAAGTTTYLSVLFEYWSSVISGIWDLLKGVGIAIWDIIEPIVTWLRKSVIISDVMWLIGKIGGVIGSIFSGLGTVISKIGEGIAWVFNHTVKPILDAIEWIYSKVKSLLGLDSKDSKVVKVQSDLSGLSPAKEAAKNLYDKPNAKVQSVIDKEKSKLDKKDKQDAGMKGGSQTKVITINKLSMVDGNFISNNKEFAQMDKAAFERYLMELFQRSMVNLGRSYS